MNSSNELSGSAWFQLPAVRRAQPITTSQNLFNNPCPIATMVTLRDKQQQQHHDFKGTGSEVGHPSESSLQVRSAH